MVQGDLQETSMATSLGPDTQNLDDLQDLPSSPKTAWIREEDCCSTSDNDTDVDMEGLRRRQGRRLSPPQTVAALGVEDQARGEVASGELGISLNMCLLGPWFCWAWGSSSLDPWRKQSFRSSLIVAQTLS